MKINTDIDTGHFYAASPFCWKVDEDCMKLMTRMADAGETEIVLWHVPVPISAEYEISSYAPQVEGARVLARYTAD